MKTIWNHYKPGYYDNKGNFIEYEKKWFCNYNKIIHQNVNEFANCIYCQKQYLKKITK